MRQRYAVATAAAPSMRTHLRPTVLSHPGAGSTWPRSAATAWRGGGDLGRGAEAARGAALTAAAP
eukprot:3457299-Prymnesium_polylepis.1